MIYRLQEEIENLMEKEKVTPGNGTEVLVLLKEIQKDIHYIKEKQADTHQTNDVRFQKLEDSVNELQSGRMRQLERLLTWLGVLILTIAGAYIGGWIPLQGVK